MVYGSPQCVADWVGQMSEEPEEVNTDFDFREAPSDNDSEPGAGEEQDSLPVDMGSSPESQSMSMSSKDNEESGCEQSSVPSLPLSLFVMFTMILSCSRFRLPTEH